MIEFQNLDGVLKSLESLQDAEKLTAAMGRACALVERAAKENAPKGTGELRRSITSEVNSNSGEIQGVVFTPLEYAPYVEFGTGLFAEGGNGRKDVPWSYQDDKGEWHSTRGMRPHPYMRPALEENREEVLRLLKEGIRND